MTIVIDYGDVSIVIKYLKALLVFQCMLVRNIMPSGNEQSNQTVSQLKKVITDLKLDYAKLEIENHYLNERIDALILTIKDVLDPKNQKVIDILLNHQVTERRNGKVTLRGTSN